MEPSFIPVPSKPRSRPRLSDVQVRELLAACEASGLPAATFARQRGIGVSRLYAWRRRFKQQAVPTAMIPVRLTPTQQPASEGVIELHRAGFVVRVVGRVDVQQLHGVLEAVQGLSC